MSSSGKGSLKGSAGKPTIQGEFSCVVSVAAGVAAPAGDRDELWAGRAVRGAAVGGQRNGAARRARVTRAGLSGGC
jgi:hypothetical protein